MFNILKIGTDTEVFLQDEKGRLVPAVGLVGGTKQKPRPLDDSGTAVQEDNVMLEFNTIPAQNAEEWLGNVNHALVLIIDEMKKKKMTLNYSPSVVFDDNQLKSAQARHMGCDPDYSAWTLSENPTQSAKSMRNVRTAGGHIHVSFHYRGKLPDRVHFVNLIRMMDLTLGVPSVILDNDDRRRSFYGVAGAHRVKHEDRVEYRTLSNFWLRNDSLKRWVYNNTVHAVRKLNQIGSFAGEEFWGETIKGDIIKCIANSDRKLAERLVETHRIPMP